MSKRVRSLADRIRDDEGVALVTVIGIMVVLTVMAIGSFVIARQALHESQRVEDESRAYRAANSGLDQVLAVYADDMEFPKTGSTPDGTYVITREQIGYGEWKLVSLGTGSDGTTETVTQRFFFMNLWEMNLAGVGSQSLISGTSGLKGSSTIVGPFYMKGNLTLGANMSVFEGPLFVKEGDIVISSAAAELGQESDPIDIFCTGAVPDGSKGSVYVGAVSRSVPLITLPEMKDGDIAAAAQAAIAQSVDNLMGTRDEPRANLECVSGNPATYTSMDPPNSATFTRRRAGGSNSNYKFIGPADGSFAAPGMGTTPLVIGGTGSFGSWGSVQTTDGVFIAGDGKYPAGMVNCWDDFAYDDVRNILYIEGTVFVDGPVTFNEDMTYVGNGSIVANGNVTIKGWLRPYGTNSNGEVNEWALGIVTPKNVNVLASQNNAYNLPNPRDETPTLAGAIYAGLKVTADANILVRGSVIAGQIDSGHANMIMVTNPLLPEYLPDSLPGSGSGLLMPTLWSRR